MIDISNFNCYNVQILVIDDLTNYKQSLPIATSWCLQDCRDKLDIFFPYA